MRFVSESGLAFVRNFKTYSSSEAADHMNDKYEHFKSDIETAEDFIDGATYLLPKEGEYGRT